MSTTAAKGPGQSRTPAIVEATRRTLDRPLASYQLVLGTSGLLLGLGLIMVLSASSVLAYNLYDGNSFAIVERQVGDEDVLGRQQHEVDQHHAGFEYLTIVQLNQDPSGSFVRHLEPELA